MTRGAFLAAALFGTLGTAAWLALQPADDVFGLPAAASEAIGAGITDARRPDAPPSRRDRRSDTTTPGAAGWPEPPSPRGVRIWRDPARAAAWMPSAPLPAMPQAPPATSRVVAVAPAPAPVPSTPAPEPTEPPQAPPFPYTLVGRVEDDGVARAVLAGPLRTLGVKASDVIDNQWRVDRVDAATLTLTWLPGGQQQTLRLRPS